MGEIIFLSIILTAAIYLFILTGSFQISILDKSGGAALFPRIVLIFLITTLIIRILKIFMSKEKESFVLVEIFKGTRGVYLFGLIIYSILMPIIGYILSSFLFVAGTMNIFTYKSKGELGKIKNVIIRNILVLGLVIGVWYFFKEILGVYLPSLVKS